MSDIPPVSRSASAYRPDATGARRSENAVVQPAASRGGDEVELSSRARLLSKLKDLPDVRQDLVDQVRSEIEAGTYETPEKVDAAVEALLQDL